MAGTSQSENSCSHETEVLSININLIDLILRLSNGKLISFWSLGGFCGFGGFQALQEQIVWGDFELPSFSVFFTSVFVSLNHSRLSQAVRLFLPPQLFANYSFFLLLFSVYVLFFVLCIPTVGAVILGVPLHEPFVRFINVIGHCSSGSLLLKISVLYSQERPLVFKYTAIQIWYYTKLIIVIIICKPSGLTVVLTWIQFLCGSQ